MLLTSTQTDARPFPMRAMIVFLLAAGFYLYEFILQVSPAAMYADLIRDFALSADGLGLLAGAYFYAYAPMQLPAGLLYDRFGPRIVLALAIIMCAAGAIFFAMTYNIYLAAFGRFLIGVGSACSFIGSLVLISRWFPARYFALMVGITQLMSSVGAIVGEAPLAYFSHVYHWRSVIFFIASAGFFLALLVWTVVRDYPNNEKHEIAKKSKRESELKKLAKVCSRSQTWFIAVYAFCVWAPVIVFASLWGVPFLVDTYHISTEHATSMMMMVWIGIGIASPVVGWLSDRFGYRCFFLDISALLGFFAFIGILYVPLPESVMWILLLLFGFAASGQSLSFAVVKDNNSLHDMGTATGFNNMATVAGGALLQPLVGLLLTFFWQGNVHAGVPVYTLATYQKVLMVLPLCYLLAFIISRFFIRETYCCAVEKVA